MILSNKNIPKQPFSSLPLSLLLLSLPLPVSKPESDFLVVLSPPSMSNLHDHDKANPTNQSSGVAQKSLNQNG